VERLLVVALAPAGPLSGEGKSSPAVKVLDICLIRASLVVAPVSSTRPVDSRLDNVCDAHPLVVQRR
jgi:hypothetical protein